MVSFSRCVIRQQIHKIVYFELFSVICDDFFVALFPRACHITDVVRVAASRRIFVASLSCDLQFNQKQTETVVVY